MKNHALPKLNPEQIIIDPVCKMSLDRPLEEYSNAYQGETHYFCSPDCLEKFKSDPQQYLRSNSTTQERPAPQAPAADVTVYTCPMHPEVRKDGPGDYPKCGMALERETPQAPPSKTEWTCPMHPVQ